MKTGIQVGPSTAAIEAMREAILDILHSNGVDNYVKKEALRVLGNATASHDISISDCTVVDNTEHHQPPPAPEPPWIFTQKEE